MSVPSPKSSTVPIKAAIASYGLSGQVFHGPFIHCHPQFELVAVCERSKSLSRQLNSQHEIVRDYQALLDNPAIELIVVNTPSNLHANMTRQALEAGKHVVVEKPFVPTSREGQALIELAQQQQRMLSVYHNRRWEAGHLTAKQLLDKGTLGELKIFKSVLERWRPQPGPKKWKEEPHPAAGLLYDIGAHQLDELLLLFGWPKSLYADMRTLRAEGQVDDYYEVHCDYGSFKAVIGASLLASQPQPAYQLYGTEGSYQKAKLDVQEGWLGKGKLPERAGWSDEPDNEWGMLVGNDDERHYPSVSGDYMGYYQNIADHLRGNAPLAITAEHGLNVIRFIEWIQQAASTQQVITREHMGLTD